MRAYEFAIRIRLLSTCISGELLVNLTVFFLALANNVNEYKLAEWVLIEMWTRVTEIWGWLIVSFMCDLYQIWIENKAHFSFDRFIVFNSLIVYKLIWVNLEGKFKREKKITCEREVLFLAKSTGITSRLCISWRLVRWAISIHMDHVIC